MTRARLPTDCVTPSTWPCSLPPARREIRLFSAGWTRPSPIASTAKATAQHRQVAGKRHDHQTDREQHEAAQQQPLLTVALGQAAGQPALHDRG